MRVIGRVLLSAVLLILSALLLAAAAFIPEVFFGFYGDLSRRLLDWIGSVTGLLPFALWEWLTVLAVLLGIYFLIRRRKLIRWLSGLLMWCSVVIFAFVALWGVNYYAPSVAERVQLKAVEPTAEQLKQTALYMAQQAQELEAQVARDDAGIMTADFDRWAQVAHDGYDALAQRDGFFQVDTPVKKLFFSEAFSHIGFQGIYVPLTAEVCVNDETFAAAMPFTMCHELSHNLTVAREDEANFCAFLACIEHPEAAFQYSGWYSAFHYTYAALREADPVAAQEVASAVSEVLWQDVLAEDEQYATYDTAVLQLAQKANDLYLNAFGEEGDSYDQVVRLLTAWYAQKVTE